MAGKVKDMNSLRGRSILVTGATGFIGTCLVERLLENGAKVSVFTRRKKVAQRLWGDAVQVFTQLSQIPACDYYGVINLAGAPIMAKRWSARRKELLLQSRVNFTQELLAQLQKVDKFPDVVISGSAIGYYGPDAKTPLDESAARGQGFAADLCARWEQAAIDGVPSGSRLCVLRTGVVLDSGGGALAQMQPPFKLGLGGPMGSGQQWMSWIHREDLVGMILWLLTDTSVSGAVNGVSPEPVTNKQFSFALAQALRRPCVFAMPKFVVKLLLGQAGEELLLGSSYIKPQIAISNGFSYRYGELGKALSDSVKK